ncbi:MAG: YeeE/YedE family protein [Bacteroidetes bacterium]|nr:MAG: YeeE/YedE family protein [Bacteroidota bacterium]
MIEWLTQPWSWWFSGIMISGVMLALLFFGKSFGVSDTLRAACAIGGAGRRISFFNYDWKNGLWNIVFITGAVIGGFIAHQFLGGAENGVRISEATLQDLTAMGVQADTSTLAPTDIFSWENLFTLQGLIFMVGGGFLVGFGARYAGGCTSGHAISGLSNLQLPSLIAVIGFFIGGLLMTHLILPVFLSW